MKRLACQATVLLLGLLSQLPTAAAGLSVTPLRLELPPDGRPEVVRLQNPADVATLVKIEAIIWADPGDLDAMPIAPEILVVPPVVKLEPKGLQVIRVALRRPLEAPTEQAYRLLITEVPIESDPNLNGLSFAVRMNLPVFAAPTGARPDPVWTLRETSDGTAELVLRNQGQAHLRISKLALHEPGGVAPLFTIDQAATALPDNEHRWLLDRPPHALPARLEVRAETHRGELVMPLTHVRE